MKPQQGIMSLTKPKQRVSARDSRAVDQVLDNTTQMLGKLDKKTLGLLLQLTQYIKANKPKYKELMANLEAKGSLPPGVFPREYDPKFLSVFALSVAKAQQAKNGMAAGGIAGIAQTMRNQGRGKDTMLAHISPEEAELLEKRGGVGTINPATGLPEYGIFDDIGNALSGVGNAVGSVLKPVGDLIGGVLSSPLGLAATAAAAYYFMGPGAAVVPSVAEAALPGALATEAAATALTPAAIESGIGSAGYGYNASAAASGLFDPSVIGSGAAIGAPSTNKLLTANLLKNVKLSPGEEEQSDPNALIKMLMMYEMMANKQNQPTNIPLPELTASTSSLPYDTPKKKMSSFISQPTQNAAGGGLMTKNLGIGGLSARRSQTDYAKNYLPGSKYRPGQGGVTYFTPMKYGAKPTTPVEPTPAPNPIDELVNQTIRGGGGGDSAESAAQREIDANTPNAMFNGMTRNQYYSLTKEERAAVDAQVAKDNPIKAALIKAGKLVLAPGMYLYDLLNTTPVAEDPLYTAIKNADLEARLTRDRAFESSIEGVTASDAAKAEMQRVTDEEANIARMKDAIAEQDNIDKMLDDIAESSKNSLITSPEVSNYTGQDYSLGYKDTSNPLVNSVSENLNGGYTTRSANYRAPTNAQERAADLKDFGAYTSKFSLGDDSQSIANRGLTLDAKQYPGFLDSNILAASFPGAFEPNIDNVTASDAAKAEAKREKDEAQNVANMMREIQVQQALSDLSPSELAGKLALDAAPFGAFDFDPTAGALEAEAAAAANTAYTTADTIDRINKSFEATQRANREAEAEAARAEAEKAEAEAAVDREAANQYAADKAKDQAVRDAKNAAEGAAPLGEGFVSPAGPIGGVDLTGGSGSPFSGGDMGAGALPGGSGAPPSGETTFSDALMNAFSNLDANASLLGPAQDVQSFLAGLDNGITSDAGFGTSDSGLGVGAAPSDGGAPPSGSNDNSNDNDNDNSNDNDNDNSNDNGGYSNDSDRGDARGGYLQNGRFDQRMARGGIAALYNLGSYSDGGRLLKGPGDGVSDSIPATIGRGQPARLADGEFVIPARIVSELGNGSTDAGAKRLYEMMDRIQKVRRKTKNVAANTKAAKYLPA